MNNSPNTSRTLEQPEAPSAPRSPDTGQWDFKAARSSTGSRAARGLVAGGGAIAVSAFAAIIAIAAIAGDPPDSGPFITANTITDNTNGRLSGGIRHPANPLPDSARTPVNGDGTFVINEDMSPGSYTTVVPKDSPRCQWTVLGTVDGRETAVGMGVGTPGARFDITVSKSDSKFETMGCGEWEPA